MRKDILAVVLNYNGGNGVLETIASLQRGSVAPEIVVVDNASTDGSNALIRKRFPEISFLPQTKNSGFAAGMNTGIRFGMERGSNFFWLVNNDAIVEKDSLEHLLEHAEKNPHEGVWSPAIFTSAGEPWFLGGKISYFRMRTLHVNGQPVKDGYLTGCALFFSREVVEKVGFLDERYFLYYEDAAFSLAAQKAGFKPQVVSEARVIHRERSQTNPEKIYWLVRSGIRFFRTESPWYWSLWIEIFLILRKVKNQIDLLFFPSERARQVRRAYVDAN